MKIIESINKREWDANGKHYEKFTITFQGDGQKYDSFCGKWNSFWQVGTEVDIPEGQIKPSTNPKWNPTITAPESAKWQGGGVGGGQPMNPQREGGYVMFDHFNKIINDLGERIAKLEGIGGSVDPNGEVTPNEIDYAKEQNKASYEDERNFIPKDEQ